MKTPNHPVLDNRENRGELDVFFNPKSVAVIGATERPGSWGAAVLGSLISHKFAGSLYPVNVRSKKIFNLPAFKDVREIPGPIDLAVLTIPEQWIEATIQACGQKQVAGIIIVTSGFGETSDKGLEREKKLVRRAHALGMRLVGPNVSGAFNLHTRFVAAGARSRELRASPLAAVTQGGFAFSDLLASGCHRGMGVGKFIHTGNECDLNVADFIQYFGRDPEVKAILLYIESIREGKRFMEITRQVCRQKPVVVYKAGRTPGSARAARSHTAALAGHGDIYKGLFNQVGIVLSPTMELLLPLGHALIERPGMRGPRVGIITMGGSWGVMLSDFIEEAGLIVPELSPVLQKRLHDFGMPERASTRNPIDIGAAGPFPSVDMVLDLGREVLSSGEIDGLVLHGIGRPGMSSDDDPPAQQSFLDVERRLIHGFNALEKELHRPVLIGSHYTPWESQAVSDLNKEGIRIYNRIDDIAQILARLHRYWLSLKSSR